MAKCSNCGAELFPGKTTCAFCSYAEEDKIKTTDFFIPDDIEEKYDEKKKPDEEKKEESSEEKKSMEDIREGFEKKMDKQTEKIEEIEKKYGDEYELKKDKKADIVQKALAIKLYSKFTFPFIILAGILFLYVYWMESSRAKTYLILVACCVIALAVIGESLAKKMHYKALEKEAKEKKQNSKKSNNNKA